MAKMDYKEAEKPAEDIRQSAGKKELFTAPEPEPGGNATALKSTLGSISP